MRIHSPHIDYNAVRVAEEVKRIAQPELAILFGSRAKGTHHEHSDLDIMLVTDTDPDQEYRANVAAEAAAYAERLYPQPVAIQLVWRRVDEFRRNRHYVNSVETNARKEGVIVGAGGSRYEDEAVESEYDWGEYDRMLDGAQRRLGRFQRDVAAAEEDEFIGESAQSALERAMKVLLEAHQAPYARTHSISDLLGSIRRTDPEMREFRLPISPDIYSQYAGSMAYVTPKPNAELTAIDEYASKTTEVIDTILRRAQQVRSQAAPA